MADNTTLDAGSGGDVIATDDIAGVKHQRVKIQHGVDGSATDVSAASPLPVTANLSAVDNAVLDAIDAVLDLINAKLVGGTIIGDVNLSATDNAVLDSIVTNVAAIVAAEGAALGSGVLLQGDDGTDRKNINVDAATGKLQVDVFGTVTANLSAVDNAVLDAIDAVLDLINAKLVSGTIIGDVNLSATDNAVLDAMAASLVTIVASVGGTHVDDAAFTAGADDGVPIFAKFDDTSPDSVDEDDAGIIRMSANRNLYNTIRDAAGNERGVNVDASNQLAIVGPVNAAAVGGMSFDMLALAASDNDKIIKASAGTLYFISVQSIDATPVYLKLFDAASITPGTTAADLQFMCPAAATAANGAGIVLNFSPGIEFATGIVALIATGVALDDNTAVGANEVIVTLGFK